MSPPPRRRLELASVVVTNFLPLAGVAFWGWSIAALVLVYWLELGVLLWWATVRALFAQRPSENFGDQFFVGATRHKRGGLSVPRTDLSIPVQHLPVLVPSVVVLGLLWLFAGGVSVAGLEASAAGVALDRERTTVTVALGALGIFVSSGLSTVSEYFLAGEYEDVNAQMALRTALWPILALTLVLVVSANVVAAGETSAALLVGVVGVKFLFDLVGVYRDKLRAFDERDAVEFGWAYDPPEWPPVDGDLSGPVETVRPRPLAVLASGPARGVVRFHPACLVSAFLVGSLLMLALGAPEAALVFGVVGAGFLCAFALLGVADESIRHLTMEYRIAGDVVGYDRLLGEPQWRVSEREIAEAERTESRIDRLLGTETLVVEGEERTIRLANLPDAAVVRSAARSETG